MGTIRKTKKELLMPRSKNVIWKYVSIHTPLYTKIQEIVNNDHYPVGKWHSIAHYVNEKLKEATEPEKHTTT
jgi:hypothetical protein